ncbi:respiratory burst oxidase homolog protein B isoform X3 [Aegilops tauschii subsp. strangulata]|uniref:respiratory burst oxidase homolog protein B isoform X3 n=1 Tax=Aegilops tauschii subsp. strangulata TaxID=200361 RepID=UPI00098A6F0D|nr:respiratory burst oxidase homolog protein B isoform X3 [Aegilops tauschii subsp. strangulata]
MAAAVVPRPRHPRSALLPDAMVSDPAHQVHAGDGVDGPAPARHLEKQAAETERVTGRGGLASHGMEEAAFAGELFDTLGRRRRISGDSIDKAELREFWDQISAPSYESRLQLFFDMVDKDADGRISQVEFKQIITLSASANKLTVGEQDSEECARLIMEKLDPDSLGYIELYDLETLLVKLSTTTNGDEPSKPMAEPNPLRRWYRHARYFLKDNWRPCWAASLNRRGSGFDRSMPSAPARALEGLKFVSGTDASDGWTDAERFFDRNARLPRSMFGQCIGMKEAAFAGELFDTLGRQRRISGDSIDKAELLEFWDQISDRSYVGRLQLFFDMVDKDANGRISQVEFKQIITLSASANKLKVGEQDSEECARLIMEKLDPDGLGYIELYDLEKLLVKPSSELMPIEMTTNGDEPSKPMVELNPLRRWYRHARYFLKDNWRRCWVMLLWLSICVGLFAWKFVQYRHRPVFQVMGYCVCVAKGGAETLKFNMALTLLPVCRNVITWLRSRTTAGRFVPFNDNLNFHKVIAVGISVGAGLHVVSHLACDFPRLLHATDDEYEPMKQFFGDVKPPNYWWFVKGTEGWTGLVMLVLMAIAFTLATGRFRNRTAWLPKPKKQDDNLPQHKKRDNLPGLLHRLTEYGSASRNRLTMLFYTLLNRFTGYNAFLYTHHLFVIVYALLIVHGHFLYLTKKWQKKTTWMYLAVPMIVYACERLTRTLRSRVRAVHKVKAVVHPDPAALLSLHLSKPEGFRYKSGQYIFVKCPNVSSFEWHPFSITSAPEDDYVSVHIKAMGDWTKDLRDAFLKVCEPLTEEKKTEILRVEYDHDKAMPTLGGRLKYPTVLIDGPYGAPAQDYKQYETLLLVGLGIGATPMISIIKDIINNMKRLPGDIESGNPSDGSRSSSFRTRRAYFYWITREQESLEWFHGIMDEVAETDKQGVIELHVHCTSVHGEGDAQSAVITVAQSLNHDKHGIDIISGTRVKTSFGRANWSEVYRRIARQNQRKHVGVFYCGMPALTKELRELAKVFSRETSTTFEFHKENF